MSTKIIFVGPSGSGKTTLRKVFFEGESSFKLLEYALEPTYGEESLILRFPGLDESIGIFDLAGQENERWLETEDKAIFQDTTMILVVIDITLGLDYILDFVKKIIDIRNQITHSTMIYVLIHKIDLVQQQFIIKINSGIIDAFSKEKLIKFMFTSLKQPYFIQTFSYFIEIIKKSFQGPTPEESLMFNVIDESIKIIYQIDKEVTISKRSLRENSNIPEKLLNYLIEHLGNKGHIQITNIKNREILSLTDNGRYNFKKILKQFTSDYDLSPQVNHINSELLSEQIPPFIGALISNKSGILLLKIELFEGALEKYLLNKVQDNENASSVDLELIPMFMSAIEKFSTQININDLIGFDLVGSNLKMQIYGYENYIIIFFMNPNINVKPVDYEINEFFHSIFEEYRSEFDIANKQGKVNVLFPLAEIGKGWLEELNESYKELIFKLETYDDEQAQVLYSKIEALYNRIDIKFSLILEKIKVMKVNLMKGILEKDFEEITKIAKLAQELSTEYDVEL